MYLGGTGLELGHKAVAGRTASLVKGVLEGKVGGGGIAGHGDEAAGGVNRHAVSLVIAAPSQKTGVN